MKNPKRAGRKPLPPTEKAKGFCVYWKPELIAKLDSCEGSRSEVLRKLFLASIKRGGSDNAA